MSGPAVHARTHDPDNGTDPLDWLPALLGDAIRFGIENDGNWLDVRTTTTGPSGYGIYLKADAVSVVDPGILFESTGYISISSGDVQIGSNIALEVTPAITTIGVGNSAVFPREIRLNLANTTTTPQGSKVVVYDSNLDPVFEVRDDGTFHIKTGGTWVADL